MEIARDIKFMDRKLPSLKTTKADPLLAETEDSESKSMELQYDMPANKEENSDINDESKERGPNVEDEETRGSVNDVEDREISEFNDEEVGELLDEDPNDSENEDEANQGKSTRGRGRPRIIRTGIRGRPRKQYASQAEIIEETAYLGEVPIQEAVRGPDAEEWNKTL